VKRIIVALLLVATLFALTACGNKPEKTAQAFFNAMETHDIAAAKKLATQDSQALLTMAEGFLTEMDADQKAKLDKLKYNILETKVDGDSAVVTYEEWEAASPEAKKTKTLNMVKEDGNWKVKVEKEDGGK